MALLLLRSAMLLVSYLVGCAHLGAQALFCIRAPVLAIEADEDRGVRNGHAGFEDEDMKDLSLFVDGFEDGVVRQRLDVVTLQELADLGSIGGCPV